MRHHEQDLPEDLRAVAERLRAEAHQPTPESMERVKVRAMRAAGDNSEGQGETMRSRIATLLAAGALVAAAGGTFAVAGPDGGGESQSAAVAQYKPAKDCSDKKNETAAAKACKPKQGVKGARAKKRGYRLVIKKGVVIRVYPDGRRVVQRKGGKAKQGAQAEKQGS